MFFSLISRIRFIRLKSNLTTPGPGASLYPPQPVLDALNCRLYLLHSFTIARTSFVLSGSRMASNLGVNFSIPASNPDLHAYESRITGSDDIYLGPTMSSNAAYWSLINVIVQFIPYVTAACSNSITSYTFRLLSFSLILLLKLFSHPGQAVAIASAPVFSASLIRSPAAKAANSGLDSVTPPPTPPHQAYSFILCI